MPTTQGNTTKLTNNRDRNCQKDQICSLKAVQHWYKAFLKAGGQENK